LLSSLRVFYRGSKNTLRPGGRSVLGALLSSGGFARERAKVKFAHRELFRGVFGVVLTVVECLAASGLEVGGREVVDLAACPGGNEVA
jgi:hypothetical protein